MPRCGWGSLSSYGDLMLCNWAEQSNQAGRAEGDIGQMCDGVAAIADSWMRQLARNDIAAV